MKLLKKLYRISSPSRQESKMQTFITSLLKGANIPYEMTKNGNIYAVKGEADEYPCVVCHIDEVHDARKSGYVVAETNGIIYGINTESMSYEGIGADDKNGIWVCLKALSEFDILKCVFFVSEEVGCIGSNAADMKFFDDCRFVLQCDRKGSSDFITNASGTDLCSDDFITDANIKKYGYREANGMMTDVMTLKERGLKVSCCNISCGYYNPHSKNEMTRISDLLNCYELVKNIILTCTKVYPHKYKKPKYKSHGCGLSRYWSDWGDYDYFEKGRKKTKTNDNILNNLKELNFSTFKNKNGKYMAWNRDAQIYVEVSEEDMMYAKNIDKYRYLQDIYDIVKFDKDGNPLVKNYGESEYYEPVHNDVDEDLHLEQYDKMCIHMSDIALTDPEAFKLDTYISLYGEQFPLLDYTDYSIACEDIVGCIV